MDADESNEYYATEDIDLDEYLGVDESDSVDDRFEDTKVTSEDFISIENLDFIEEDLSKLLTSLLMNLTSMKINLFAKHVAKNVREKSSLMNIQKFVVKVQVSFSFYFFLI